MSDDDNKGPEEAVRETSMSFDDWAANLSAQLAEHMETIGVKFVLLLNDPDISRMAVTSNVDNAAMLRALFNAGAS
jgi:hypothetical protein